ncbi:hypothetical protein COJ37_23615 [Bacillus cereus]|uniref:hypothetical protein n=1 Tax=Bacillus cereus TaxID=1396 RepID=UPI000BF591EA|nr:hypothetical protein [Bacillus cereus]PFL95349.1 hypothetical protein COJ37_23615 [Bacillus cereus]
MINIKEMKKDIEILERKFQTSIIEYFKSDKFPKEFYSKLEKDIRISKIKKHQDLNQLFYGAGFYNIVTDCKNSENPCELIYEKAYKVIYRGHCTRIKKRVESHLFNDKYNSNTGRTSYNVCMKVEPNVSGINIDLPPYKNFNWFVIQISLPKSNKIIREQAEIAFDQLYKKPLASRD